MGEFFKIIDCPRDAMQGIHDFIPTEFKIDHLTKLLDVGFDSIDCGSFVSPKAIPQMADTKDVLDALDVSKTSTKRSVIVANKSGVQQALSHTKVNILGFPFSISEKFQQYNTKKSRDEAFELIKIVQKEVSSTNKKLLIYFSMAFGNPYGETWRINEVKEWVKKMNDIGITQINLSDTVGVAEKKVIEELFKTLTPLYPNIEFGAHFHTIYEDWFEKVDTAYQYGCRKFDGAIKGFGGCPMAKSALVGNMPTEKLISYANTNNIDHQLDLLAFETAYNSAIKTIG